MGPGRPPGGGWCGPVVVRACPDPALCPGPGVPGCPTAVALHRLRDAPITAAVVRAVAGLDPVLLAGPEQADLLRILHRVSTWALTRASDCARTVAHASAADDSAGDAVVDPVLLGLAAREVAIATHVSPGSARWRLSTHTDLAGRAPGLLTALRAGDSSPQHARLLAEETEGLDDPAARWVATQVHPVLLAGTRGQLRRALRLTIAAWHAAHPPEPEPDQPADPEEPAEPAAAEGADAAVGAGGDDGSPRAGRRVELEPLADGMAWIHALLPAEDTAALWTRLDAAVPNSGSVHNPDRPDRPDRPGGPDPRTPDQIRADTLAAWGWHGHPDPPDRALTPLPAGRVLGRVHVTLNLATLLGLREDPAALGLAAPGHPGHDLGPITPAAARRIAADADWQRFLHDPTGTLSGVSTHYPIPAEVRRLLIARYAACTGYGSTLPAASADLDHAIPWTPHNPRALTHHGNLHPAARGLHNGKTHHGWHVTISPDHTVTWTSPLGQTTTTRPIDYTLTATLVDHATTAKAQQAQTEPAASEAPPTPTTPPGLPPPF